MTIPSWSSRFLASNDHLLVKHCWSLRKGGGGIASREEDSWNQRKSTKMGNGPLYALFCACEGTCACDKVIVISICSISMASCDEASHSEEPQQNDTFCSEGGSELTFVSILSAIEGAATENTFSLAGFIDAIYRFAGGCSQK